MKKYFEEKEKSIVQEVNAIAERMNRLKQELNNLETMRLKKMGQYELIQEIKVKEAKDDKPKKARNKARVDRRKA